MIERIKKWLNEKEVESRLINKGKLMYHKGLKLKGDEDLLVQKGYFKAEREDLRSIERLKRLKESNQRMKINNNRKPTIKDDPFRSGKW